VQWRQLTPAYRYRSFLCAVKGVCSLAGAQPNTWLIGLATVFVTVLGFYLRLGWAEWCFVLSAVFMVWLAETFNTAIEVLTDLVSPEHHPLAGKAKDIAAGAVLIAVVYSLFVAGIIFAPKIWALA